MRGIKTGLFFAVGLLVLGTMACKPKLEDCPELIPMAAEEVSVMEQGDMWGCAGKVQEIEVFVETVRVKFHWERGRLWVDGDEVDLEDFEEAVNYARARRVAEEAGEAAAEVIEQTGEVIRGFLKGLRGDDD